MASRNFEVAKRWFIGGRVQGVGFRFFAQRAAAELGLTGYTRNLDDGRVEVYAMGSEKQLSDLAARLHHGPALAQVYGVEEQAAEMRSFDSFLIEP
jgi:acylphosphatase